eukprot:gene9468-19660_t
MTELQTVFSFPKISRVTGSIFNDIDCRYKKEEFCSKQEMEDQQPHCNESIFCKMQKPVNVVFDLDRVLISNICLVEERYDFHELKNIGEDSVIESCGHYFYLYNGWKELIKYVMELSDNKLIFFSSGARERNERIIPKMLERVLERNPTDYIRKHVKIFSRDHTIDTSIMSKSDKEKLEPDGMWGNLKKDLTVAVSPEELKHTLLIDDSESSTLRGQERNLLKVDGSSVRKTLASCMKKQHPTIAREWKLVGESNIPDLDLAAFFTLNKLFYAAGVLKDITDKYSKTDRDLIDIMYDDHGFKITKRSKGYEKNFEICHRMELYLSGLEVLREFNTDLDFVLSPFVTVLHFPRIHI